MVSLKRYDGWGTTFFLREWVKELKQKYEIAAYYVYTRPTTAFFFKFLI